MSKNFISNSQITLTLKNGGWKSNFSKSGIKIFVGFLYFLGWQENL